jgi:hypothetical protein
VAGNKNLGKRVRWYNIGTDDFENGTVRSIYKAVALVELDTVSKIDGRARFIACHLDHLEPPVAHSPA